jgi:hypothetical protein
MVEFELLITLILATYSSSFDEQELNIIIEKKSNNKYCLISKTP